MDKRVFFSFPQIETERLVLRKLERSDSEVIYSILSDEKAMIYYGIYPIESIDIAQWFINQYISGFFSETIIRWGITLKSTGQLIGTCGYQGLNEGASRAELGYELKPEFWGKGYMHEALSHVIQWGFEQFDLNRIEALIYPENRASENVVRQLGFTFEGKLAEYAYFRESYTDLNLFRLLKREYLIT